MSQINATVRNILLIVAILVFLASIGWNDWQAEKKFTDTNKSVKIADGWNSQPENVFYLEVVPAGGLRDEPIAIGYEYNGTKYAYTPRQQNIDPGFHYADPRRIWQYQDIVSLRNNTSENAICMEKFFIDESHESLTDAYVIILGNEVDFFYQTKSYEIKGYDSKILDITDGFLKIEYTPNMVSYFFYFILPDWIVFSVLALCAISWLPRTKKKA